MKIGPLTLKNNIILAPMAGISDYPFRVICRDYGCSLGYSEMISSEGLIRQSEKTLVYLYKDKAESLNGNYIAFQIFGQNPSVMAEASYIAEEKGADIIDINMGCPVKKVVKTGAGSALLGDLKKVEDIIIAIKKKITIPLTVKIRAGWLDTVNIIETSKVLYNSGVDAIIIHPRTQKQGFRGKPDWNLIKLAKDTVPIPIIGNGDVRSYKDFVKIKEETNCDAVMIGRGAMGKPWIFSTSYLNRDYTPLPSEIKEVVKKHFNLTINYYGEDRGTKIMRKHIAWYTKGLKGGKSLRKKINSLTKPKDIINEIDLFFIKTSQKMQNSKTICKL